jgi:hypothetical protein
MNTVLTEPGHTVYVVHDRPRGSRFVSSSNAISEREATYSTELAQRRGQTRHKWKLCSPEQGLRKSDLQEFI